MNPLSYLSLLPGLLSKRPGESQDTKAGRSGLMGVNSAYQGLQSTYGQAADQSRAQYNDQSQKYLSMLGQPVGSDAEDSTIIGRAQEGNAMGARRSAARIANNPDVIASGGQAGAMAGVEQSRLAADAQLHAKVADMNLMQRRQRQQQIVDFLSRELSRNQAGLSQALGGQAGISSQLLGLGQRQDANNRADSANSSSGLMSLLYQLGQVGAK